MDVTRSWEDSLTGRLLKGLMRWAAGSVTALLLAGTAGFLTAAGRGSLAGRFLAQDLAGSRLLAGSRVAAWSGRWGRRLEVAALAAGRWGRAALASSRVAEAARGLKASAVRGGAAFLAGGALGLSAGVVLLGWARGGLTPRRLAAAALLALAGGVLAVSPGEPARWWEGSLAVRLGRWLVNLGRGEEESR